MTDYSWKGGYGAYDDAGKWEPHGVPGSGDSAEFALGGTVTGGAGGGLDVETLSIDSNVVFTSSAAASTTGGFFLSGGSLKLEDGSSLGAGLGGQSSAAAAAVIDGGGVLTVSDSDFGAGAGQGGADAPALIAGYFGSGTITVNSSGVLGTGAEPLILGMYAGSFGKLAVTGGGSVYNYSGTDIFGMSGSADVVLNDGSMMDIFAYSGSEEALELAVSSGSIGTLTVAGSGSVLVTNGGTVSDGIAGMGKIVIEQGAILSQGFNLGVVLGGVSGGSGTLIIDHATFTDEGQLFVGSGGTGSYVQEDGAQANIGGGLGDTYAAMIVGDGYGSSHATVTGSGTHMAISGQLAIDDGSFLLASGATVATGTTSGQTGVMVEGKLIVSGSGSDLLNTGMFAIDGMATVADDASIVTSVSSGLGVDGTDVDGTLNVENGASFSDAGNFVEDGRSKVNITSGGSLSAGGAIEIGVQSSGLARLIDGGTLTGASLSMGQTGSDAAGAASLTVDGGVVRLTGDAEIGKHATITMDAGVIRAASLDFSSGGALTGYGSVQAQVTAAAVTASGGKLTIEGAVSGTGMLTIGANAALGLESSVEAGNSIEFAGSGNLQLGDPAAMNGAIGNFLAGDKIVLTGLNEDGYAYSGGASSGQLTVDLSGGGTVTLAFLGSYSASSFHVTDGNAGVIITHSG